MLPSILLTLITLSLSTYHAAAQSTRGPGVCSMYSSCGLKGGIFGQELPCAVTTPAHSVDDALNKSLHEICQVNWDKACCTQQQLETLQASLSQAEPLIALCPACRYNFRSFYCALTCSPDQSLFVTVTSNQNLSKEADVGPAVKSLNFHVDRSFGEGFFNSCKSVKFGATNGYAMDLIGGGAKDWLAFLKYMGAERPGLGSPFQIDFPQPPGEIQYPNKTVKEDLTIIPLNSTPLSCASDDPNARCACADCPEVCLELPDKASPAEERANQCRVGKLQCFSFILVILYFAGLVSFLFGFGIQKLWNKRSDIMQRLRHRPSDLSNAYDRVPLEDPRDEDSPSDWRSNLSSQRKAPSDSSGFNTASPGASLSKHRLGRGASLLEPDPLVTYQPRTYALNAFLHKVFYNLGLFCGNKPYLVIAIALTVCGILNSGWSRFAVEKDPVKLWVAPGSTSALNKEIFEENFGPFYRTQQFFITSLDESEPVLSWERLKWLETFQSDIASLQSQHGYRLTDVCFAPTPDVSEPSQCVVQSILGYFQDSIGDSDELTWRERLNECASSPSLCLPLNGIPLNPRPLLGGVPNFSGDRDATGPVMADQAKALVVTYVVKNSLNTTYIAIAEEWERSLEAYLARTSNTVKQSMQLRLTYSTGISLETELNKSTNTDIPIVVLSYCLMFLYISLNLGGTLSSLGQIALLVASRLFRRVKAIVLAQGAIRLSDETEEGPPLSVRRLLQQMLIRSKFMLGLWGIVTVLLSVSTAVGIFSFLRIKITLIIAEVIPFLVLAIGVDNVFLLSHELARQNEKAYSNHQGSTFGYDENAVPSIEDETDPLPTAAERVARSLAKMGPSILLSTTCEAVAFALGALVGMPAVRNFAIYAAGSVVINSLLQVTMFMSLMTLDLQRTEANRADCLPCFQMPSITSNHFSKGANLVGRFIKEIYAPFLLNAYVKKIVLALFSLLFLLSWIAAREMDLGLDQRLALPQKSYLVDYFDSLDRWLDVGPPVYFVAEHVDVTVRQGQQALCSRFSTCDERSLSNLLEAERKRYMSSFLSEPPASWIDDFFQWLNPALESCCRVTKVDPNTFCSPDDPDFKCLPCYEAEQEEWNITMKGLPTNHKFVSYLEQWLSAPTDESCPLGGQASYSSAVSLHSNKSVKASHFRTYHTPLKSQNDFIDAMAAAERISADFTERTGLRVFPYSLFYVFFDQYITITSSTRSVLLLACFAVFLVSAFFLGSIRTGLIVTATVFSTALNVMGIMGVWHISLNAISLVNLVISVGIAVEFCSHIARAFMHALGGGLPFKHVNGAKERDERAWASLSDVGSSVFTGITMTKLIGISVLAITRSKLLKIYYFRMWLTLIIAGALHGLVLLPVLLAYQGSQGWSLESEDEDWLRENIQQNYEARPFYADDAHSDDANEL